MTIQTINDSLNLNVRDVFAIAAIAGILAYPHTVNYHLKTPDECATLAYQYADAMIEERAKP